MVKYDEVDIEDRSGYSTNNSYFVVPDDTLPNNVPLATNVPLTTNVPLATNDTFATNVPLATNDTFATTAEIIQHINDQKLFKKKKLENTKKLMSIVIAQVFVLAAVIIVIMYQNNNINDKSVVIMACGIYAGIQLIMIFCLIECKSGIKKEYCNQHDNIFESYNKNYTIFTLLYLSLVIVLSTLPMFINHTEDSQSVLNMCIIIFTITAFGGVTCSCAIYMVQTIIKLQDHLKTHIPVLVY